MRHSCDSWALHNAEDATMTTHNSHQVDLTSSIPHRAATADRRASVPPSKPAAAYFGGKIRLAKVVIKRINEVPHDAYAEPFVGMGGIFLRRPHAPRAEFINDLSGDVANFFRILQRHYAPFTEMIRYQLTGRREFERLAATDPKTLTDLERAARFLYLQKVAFGGMIVSRSFAVPVQVRVEAATLEASGTFELRQSDFGIEPFSVLGGALRVEDRLDVSFELRAERVTDTELEALSR